MLNLGGLIWDIGKERLAWNKARELLLKVQEIDSSKSEIEHTLNAGYFAFDWDFERVEAYYQRHLPELDFGSIRWMCDYAIRTGRFEETLRIIESFIQREPIVGTYYAGKAHILKLLGRPYEAMALLRDTDPLYSDNFFYLQQTAAHHYILGDFNRTRRQLKPLMNGFRDRPPVVLWLNSMLLEREGRHTESREQLDKIIQLY